MKGLRLGLGLAGRSSSSGGGGGLTDSISAPVLTLTTGQTSYPPEFDIALDDTAQVGDTIVLQWDNNADFSSVTDSASNTIDAGEAAANAATFTGLSSIASGTNRFRCRVERGAAYGAWSNTVTHGPDDIAPVLSSASCSMVSATAGDADVTTDEANGTLYVVATANSVSPSAAQVKAGQMSTGAAAAFADDQVISSTGSKDFDITGLTSSTQYYVWFMHEDATGNQSTVAAGGSFTTDAAAAFSMTHTDDPATQNIGFASQTATFSSAALGSADSSRKILVTVLQSSGGGSTDAVTVAGISATQRGSANTNLTFWEAAVPTGTTGNIVVHATANMSYCGITVVSVIGSTGAPTVHTPLTYGFYNATTQQKINVTTPSGGATYAAYEGASLSGTTAFANATKQSQDSTVGETLSTALRTTAGTADITVSGHGNQNCCMSAISYA